MTRLQAIRCVRRDWSCSIRKYFQGETYFSVDMGIDNEDVIHAMFLRHGSETAFWLRITPRQLLNFIRRNFPRKEENYGMDSNL